MSRLFPHLAQLNKTDAYKALTALTQRQQANTTQFDNTEAFAAMLDAQSNQAASRAEEPNGDTEPKQQRDAQDDAPRPQTQNGKKTQAKTQIMSAPLQRTLHHNRPVPKAKFDPAAKTDTVPVATATPNSQTKPTATDLAKKPIAYVDASDEADRHPADKPLQAAPDSDMPIIYVAQNPVQPAELPVLTAGATAATPTSALDNAGQTQPVSLPGLLATMAAQTQPLTQPQGGQPGADGSIALNDVLLPIRFYPHKPVAPTPDGTPVPQAFPLDGPAQSKFPLSPSAGVTPADFPASLLQPATSADITKAATSVLQQLATAAPATPAVHAVAQQLSKTIAPQTQAVDTATPVNIQPATPALQTDAQPVATASAPQAPSVNPLLAGADAQPVAVNPVVNPAIAVTAAVPNPALQFSAPAATFTPAAAGGFTPADAQLAETQPGIEGVAAGAVTLARYDAGNLAKTGRLSNTAAGAALPANVQVAVQLARAAKNGDSSFNIQLHPAELGRVEVKLDVDKQGGATARIMVDSQATLDLLQSHRTGLERALTDAGLKCDGGISFDLRDNGANTNSGANPGSQQQAGGNSGRRNSAADPLSGTPDASIDPSIIANLTLSLQPGRVDIKA